MFRKLRDSVAALLAALALGLGARVLSDEPPKAPRQTDQPAQERTAKPDLDKLAQAGKLFEKNCMPCHHPPDLEFATDRAWLDQINRTA